MFRIPRIALVSLDDWQILYIDGKKVFEKDRIDVRAIFTAAGLPLDYRDLEGTKFDREIWHAASTPDDLTEVPRA